MCFNFKKTLETRNLEHRITKTSEFHLTFRRRVDQRIREEEEICFPFLPSPSGFWLQLACKSKDVLKVHTYSRPQDYTAWGEPLLCSQRYKLKSGWYFITSKSPTINKLAARPWMTLLLINYTLRKLILAQKLNWRAVWNTVKILWNVPHTLAIHTIPKLKNTSRHMACAKSYQRRRVCFCSLELF